MSGPPPKPTKLKLLEGNPGHQKLNKNEVDCPFPATPEPPDWLDVIGAAEYVRVYPLLAGMGILTAIDTAAFEAYCDAYSTMVRMAIVVNECGAAYETEHGQIKARPEAQLKVQAANAVRQFCQEFGLTPSARSRIQTNADDDGPDAMEVYLKKSRAKAN